MTELHRCPRCKQEKELTTENFYVARPRPGHPKGGWQSGCIECWKQRNRENKQRRKESK